MGNMKMGAKCIENLARIGKISLESVDRGMLKRNQVEVENFMPFGEEIWNNVSSSFTAATRENDTLGCSGGGH